MSFLKMYTLSYLIINLKHKGVKVHALRGLNLLSSQGTNRWWLRLLRTWQPASCLLHSSRRLHMRETTKSQGIIPLILQLCERARGKKSREQLCERLWSNVNTSARYTCTRPSEWQQIFKKTISSRFCSRSSISWLVFNFKLQLMPRKRYDYLRFWFYLIIF